MSYPFISLSHITLQHAHPIFSYCEYSCVWVEHTEPFASSTHTSPVVLKGWQVPIICIPDKAWYNTNAQSSWYKSNKELNAWGHKGSVPLKTQSKTNMSHVPCLAPSGVSKSNQTNKHSLLLFLGIFPAPTWPFPPLGDFRTSCRSIWEHMVSAAKSSLCHWGISSQCCLDWHVSVEGEVSYSKENIGQVRMLEGGEQHIGGINNLK